MMYEAMLALAKRNGFTSVTEAINYAVEAKAILEDKNASKGQQTPANDISQDSINELWENMKAVACKNPEQAQQIVFFNRKKFDAAMAKWLDRYRVKAKNEAVKRPDVFDNESVGRHGFGTENVSQGQETQKKAIPVTGSNRQNCVVGIVGCFCMDKDRI